MQNAIKYLEKFINPVNLYAHRISMILMFGLMVLTCTDVSARTFLSQPVTGTYEITELAMALMVFLSFGYTQIKKGHISVGVIVEKLPPRVQYCIDTLVYFIILLVLILMTWQTYVYAIRNIAKTTLDLQLPIYVFIIISAIGILLFALTIAMDLLKSVVKVVNPNHEF